MMITKINSIDEFQLIESRGFRPLFNPYFSIDIFVRIEIQDMLFGIPSARNDAKFFKYIWNNTLPYCEECGEVSKKLDYSATHISHIMTKGAKPQMRYDVRNINILCFNHHNLWEYRTLAVAEKMKIYWKNIKTAELLRQEYKLVS